MVIVFPFRVRSLCGITELPARRPNAVTPGQVAALFLPTLVVLQVS